MNDFSIDIKGMRAILKPHNFWKKPSTERERTVTVVGGPGCNPDPAWGRRVEVKIEGALEECSSYDFEFVIVDGKKIAQIQPEITESIVLCDPKPEPETPKMVRRKRT